MSEPTRHRCLVCGVQHTGPCNPDNEEHRDLSHLEVRQLPSDDDYDQLGSDVDDWGDDHDEGGADVGEWSEDDPW